MKLHQVLVLSAMALALSACVNDKDKKNKPDDGKTPETPAKEVKYDGAVPAELTAKVKEANTIDKVDLLAKVKAGEAVATKLGETDVQLIGGKWSTATIQAKDSKVQGLPTSKDDIAKLESKKAVYTGIAIAPDAKEKGALKYDIDFGTNKGKGEITGIGKVAGVDKVSKIILGEAALNVNTGAGKATLEVVREAKKASAEAKTTSAAPINETEKTETAKAPVLDYTVNVYGPQANEIAGAILKEKAPEVVFHGNRSADKIPAAK